MLTYNLSSHSPVTKLSSKVSQQWTSGLLWLAFSNELSIKYVLQKDLLCVIQTEPFMLDV